MIINESGYLNTRKQGDAGLGIAIGWFCSHGYTVSIPLTDSQDYDLIVEKEDILYRVQVKTTIYKRFKYYLANLSTKGGNRSGIGKLKVFDTSRVDLLFVVTGDEKIYLIPTKRLKPKHQLILGSYFDEFIIHGWPNG